MPTTDELATELDTLKTQVPTIEELFFSQTHISWASSSTSGSTPNSGISGSTRFTLAAFNKPVRVLGMAVSFDYWNMAGSDTNYWTCSLERGNDAIGFPDMAIRSTRLTGTDANGGITRRTPWTFDAAAWNTNADIAAGEILLHVFGVCGAG